MKKQIIPIVFSANNNYALFCYIAIYSVIKHSSDDFHYEIYVLYTDMDKENRELLISLKSENANISCIDISRLTEGIELKGAMHFSIEMYYRLFIPRIFPEYNKVLYLDSDLCVLSDISELFLIDISDYAIGAVNDVASYHLEQHAMAIGGLDCRKMLNSGVLIINTDSFESNNIRSRCLKLLAEDYSNKERKMIYPDQDALNLVLNEKYYVIDQKWNYQPMFLPKLDRVLEDKRQEYSDNKDNAKIIHFSGEIKPWMNPELPKHDIFWKYAEEAGMIKRIVSKITSDVRKNTFKNECFKNYSFPYSSVPFGKKVVIYAAGDVGKAFYYQLKATDYSEIVLWVDKKWNEMDTEYGIVPIETIFTSCYDYIIIAIESERIACSVKEFLINNKISQSKIVWEKYRKIM